MILGWNFHSLTQEIFSENLQCAEDCFGCSGHKTDEIPSLVDCSFHMGNRNKRKQISRATANDEYCRGNNCVTVVIETNWRGDRALLSVVCGQGTCLRRADEAEMSRVWRNSSYESLGGQPSSTCPLLALQQVLGALLAFAFPSLQTILCAAALMAKWNPGHTLLLRTLQGLFLSVTQDPESSWETSWSCSCLPLTLSPAVLLIASPPATKATLYLPGKHCPRGPHSCDFLLLVVSSAVCARWSPYFKGSHQRGLPWPPRIAVPLLHTHLLYCDIYNHPVCVCVCIIYLYFPESKPVRTWFLIFF